MKQIPPPTNQLPKISATTKQAIVQRNVTSLKNFEEVQEALKNNLITKEDARYILANILFKKINANKTELTNIFKQDQSKFKPEEERRYYKFKPDKLNFFNQMLNRQAEYLSCDYFEQEDTKFEDTFKDYIATIQEQLRNPSQLSKTILENNPDKDKTKKQAFKTPYSTGTYSENPTTSAEKSILIGYNPVKPELYDSNAATLPPKHLQYIADNLSNLFGEKINKLFLTIYASIRPGNMHFKRIDRITRFLKDDRNMQLSLPKQPNNTQDTYREKIFYNISCFIANVRALYVQFLEDLKEIAALEDIEDDNSILKKDSTRCKKELYKLLAIYFDEIINSTRIKSDVSLTTGKVKKLKNKQPNLYSAIDKGTESKFLFQIKIFCDTHKVKTNFFITFNHFVVCGLNDEQVALLKEIDEAIKTKRDLSPQALKEFVDKIEEKGQQVYWTQKPGKGKSYLADLVEKIYTIKCSDDGLLKNQKNEVVGFSLANHVLLRQSLASKDIKHKIEERTDLSLPVAILKKLNIHDFTKERMYIWKSKEQVDKELNDILISLENAKLALDESNQINNPIILIVDEFYSLPSYIQAAIRKFFQQSHITLQLISATSSQTELEYDKQPKRLEKARNTRKDFLDRFKKNSFIRCTDIAPKNLYEHLSEISKELPGKTKNPDAQNIQLIFPQISDLISGSQKFLSKILENLKLDEKKTAIIYYVVDKQGKMQLKCFTGTKISNLNSTNDKILSGKQIVMLSKDVETDFEQHSRKVGFQFIYSHLYLNKDQTFQALHRDRSDYSLKTTIFITPAKDKTDFEQHMHVEQNQHEILAAVARMRFEIMQTFNMTIGLYPTEVFSPEDIKNIQKKIISLVRETDAIDNIIEETITFINKILDENKRIIKNEIAAYLRSQSDDPNGLLPDQVNKILEESPIEIQKLIEKSKAVTEFLSQISSFFSMTEDKKTSLTNKIDNYRLYISRLNSGTIVLDPTISDSESIFSNYNVMGDKTIKLEIDLNNSLNEYEVLEGYKKDYFQEAEIKTIPLKELEAFIDSKLENFRNIKLRINKIIKELQKPQSRITLEMQIINLKIISKLLYEIEKKCNMQANDFFVSQTLNGPIKQEYAAIQAELEQIKPTLLDLYNEKLNDSSIILPPDLKIETMVFLIKSIFDFKDYLKLVDTSRNPEKSLEKNIINLHIKHIIEIIKKHKPDLTQEKEDDIRTSIEDIITTLQSKKDKDGYLKSHDIYTFAKELLTKINKDTVTDTVAVSDPNTDDLLELLEQAISNSSFSKIRGTITPKDKGKQKPENIPLAQGSALNIARKSNRS